LLVVSELSYLPSVVVDGVAVVITCQAEADSDSGGIILITLSSNKSASHQNGIVAVGYVPLKFWVQ